MLAKPPATDPAVYVTTMVPLPGVAVPMVVVPGVATATPAAAAVVDASVPTATTLIVEPFPRDADGVKVIVLLAPRAPSPVVSVARVVVTEPEVVLVTR